MLHELKAKPSTVHWGYYDPELKPVLEIKSGDSVKLETVCLPPELISTPEAYGYSDDEIPLAFKKIYSEVREKGLGPHILTGPIVIDGSEPGDVLEIEFKDISPSLSFGFNRFRSGSGTIPEDYPYSRLKIVKFDLKSMLGEFSEDIKVPIRPFFGSIGVAPPKNVGRLSSSPPGFHGGNLDNKELVRGSIIRLPINVEGALFSIGDGHAFQGDGEVDGTALETSLNGILQFRVRKDITLKWPMAETKNHIISMGFHKNLDEATRASLRNMIDFLVTNRGLDPDEAYILTSLAVDFRITQTVNGVKGVHGLLHKEIFRFE